MLLYEPIYLEHLLARLKENGIKTKSNDVMDYLDEQVKYGLEKSSCIKLSNQWHYWAIVL